MVSFPFVREIQTWIAGRIRKTRARGYITGAGAALYAASSPEKDTTKKGDGLRKSAQAKGGIPAEGRDRE